jgi:hypothetical protein
VATLAELEQALINADAAGDADAARTLAAAVMEARNPKPPEPSMGDKLADVVTGNLRRVPSTEALPDWLSLPELNPNEMPHENVSGGPVPTIGEGSGAATRARIGSALAGPEEIAKIVQAQFPGVGVRQDEKGNFLLKSAQDGKEYAIKPGFRASDIPRAAAAFLAFTPAGRATSLPGLAAAGGATQAAIEASQAATGGEFNPGDVAGAAILPPAAALAVRGTGAAVNAVRNKLAGKPAPAPVAPQPSAPQSAPQPAAAPVAPVTPVTPIPPQQLAQTAKQAAKGRKPALQALASQASPDAETVEAAKRLGIADNLQPDHVTTNQAYRELAQAVKSIPGSEARSAELQGLEAVARRADDLITQIGGADDVADLGVRLKGSMQATQKALEDKADELYGQVRQQIPQASKVSPDNVLSLIKQRAKELGGEENLSAMERGILARLAPKPARAHSHGAAPKEPPAIISVTGEPLTAPIRPAPKLPTYALVDDVRRDVGAVVGRAGPFKDADIGLAKRLYSAIAQDQMAAAQAHGAAETYRAAQAAVATRKALEDDLVAIFGKALDRSLSPNLASSVGKLAAGDTQGLARLIEATPAHMRREVIASGLQYALSGGPKKQGITFSTYARWYEGLRKNAPAYALIAKNLDEPALKQLNDLYKVSKGISLASRERITTGRLQSVVEELKGTDTLVTKLYELAGVTSKVLAAEGVSTTAGVPGAGATAVVASALMKQKTDVLKAVDAVIASQDFLKLAAKYQATGTVDRNLVRRLAYSKAMRQLARTLRDTQRLSDPEQFILTALQASRQRESSAVPALPAPRTVH